MSLLLANHLSGYPTEIFLCLRNFRSNLIHTQTLFSLHIQCDSFIWCPCCLSSNMGVHVHILQSILETYKEPLCYPRPTTTKKWRKSERMNRKVLENRLVIVNILFTFTMVMSEHKSPVTKVPPHGVVSVNKSGQVQERFSNKDI